MSDIQTLKYGKLEWINIAYLDEETKKMLGEKFHFHHLDLEDCLSHNQRPKIDEYEKYLFIILHFPVPGTSKKNIELEELNIFIGQSYFITIHHQKLKVLNEFIEKMKHSRTLKKQYMSKGSGFLLYEIIKALFDACFSLLNVVEADIGEIEKSVFTEDSRNQDMLKDILMLKKDILIFKRIILPQRTVIAQLEHKNTKFLSADLEVYFDDVVDKIEKIWNTLQNAYELVQSLEDTNESIISHNTNMIIKTLTIFSVIMLPLTLISGIYGMNIEWLPLANRTEAFFIVSLIMFIIAVVMLTYFYFKRWL